MNKLSVFFYGPKSKFLHGNKSATDLGRLGDVVAGLSHAPATLPPAQRWLKDLCQHVRKVEDLMSLCVSYLEAPHTLDLTKLKKRPSGISDSTHSNWINPKNPGPREDIGLAMAALYGFGCPEDDPSLPLVERRKLWKNSTDPLWQLWRDGEVKDFVEAYSKAISDNTLWFPPQVRALIDRPEPAQVTSKSRQAFHAAFRSARNLMRSLMTRLFKEKCALTVTALGLCLGFVLMQERVGHRVGAMRVTCSDQGVWLDLRFPDPIDPQATSPPPQKGCHAQFAGRLPANVMVIYVTLHEGVLQQCQGIKHPVQPSKRSARRGPKKQLFCGVSN